MPESGGGGKERKDTNGARHVPNTWAVLKVRCVMGSLFINASSHWVYGGIKTGEKKKDVIYHEMLETLPPPFDSFSKLEGGLCAHEKVCYTMPAFILSLNYSYCAVCSKKKKKKGREPKKNQKQGSSSVAYIRRGMLRGLDLYLWQQRASIFFLRSHFWRAKVSIRVVAHNKLEALCPSTC